MPAQPVTGPTKALTARRLRTAFGDELAPLISLSQARPYLGLTRSAAYRRALRDPDSIPGLRGRGASSATRSARCSTCNRRRSGSRSACGSRRAVTPIWDRVRRHRPGVYVGGTGGTSGDAGSVRPPAPRRTELSASRCCGSSSRSLMPTGHPVGGAHHISPGGTPGART